MDIKPLLQRHPHSKVLLLPILLLLSITGCKKEIVPKAFYPRSEHEAYGHSLTKANLDQTALGRDWTKAAEKALDSPFEISLPFQEEFYWEPNSTDAVGYRFSVPRGVRIEVDISFHSADSLLLFADLFREKGDSVSEWIHVATADEAMHHLEFEPRRDASYVLRLQPELLRGGRFKVLVRELPSLGFPVAGKGSQSVKSFFGDPRDGGEREHHGVDIFAPRNTAVLAPSDGTVTRVGNGEIGGNYIWLYDSKRSLNLYFAHLETQEVSLNTKVEAGQVIGTVGNSGNARNTPPHLHFGIYRNGPLDPYDFIAETRTEPDRLAGDTFLLGKLVRSRRTLFMKPSPGYKGPPFDTLEIHSIMRVKALSGDFYRVLMPDGISGYIPGKEVELIGDSVLQETITVPVALLENPRRNSVQMKEVAPGEKLTVLGKYKNYFFGRTLDGATGWIPGLSLKQERQP